jgi:glutaconate CoA-transferase subunit A
MDKLISLEEAIASVRDNDMVALGGNALHRAPMSACREIARQKKRGLRLVKTAGAMDVDLLCMAGCVQSVDAGFISYETEYSLASHYRRAVQEGRVEAHEHACYTVISALRAASAGIPFMPVKGLMISDLIEANDYFDSVRDPFGGEEIHVVKALQPDVCILHVQEAERNGNAAIDGPQYEDVLMSRASKRVIITAERIVPEKHFSYAKRKADIPHFLVDAVVHVPRGASPCSCSGLYDINRHQLGQFKKLTSDEELQGYLDEMRRADRGQ